tara:strand:+ start:2395 stop:2856 length:462 start_codon:yes stop_codon:yes gene_type:complete
MINPLAMKKHPAPRRRIELGFIAALALVLAAFEWTAYEYDTAEYSAYTEGLTLEAEVVPPNAPSKPVPPVRNLLITPEIHPDPPLVPNRRPTPTPPLTHSLEKSKASTSGILETATMAIGRWKPFWWPSTCLISLNAPTCWTGTSNALARKGK